MSGTKTRTLNKALLMSQLEALGITAAQASEELGFSTSYLSQCFAKKRIPNHTIRLIDFRYGIKPESYLVAEDEPPQDVRPSEVSELLRSVYEEMRDIRKLLEDLTLEAVQIREDVQMLRAYSLKGDEHDR